MLGASLRPLIARFGSCIAPRLASVQHCRMTKVRPNRTLKGDAPPAALRAPVAEKHGQLRVVDESGEDYLYPRRFFVPVELPQSIRRAVLLAA